MSALFAFAGDFAAVAFATLADRAMLWASFFASLISGSAGVGQWLDHNRTRAGVLLTLSAVAFVAMLMLGGA